jgi:MraZ protein
MARAAASRGEERSDSPPEIVVPVMTGTHFHALDDKGRVIVPAKLRPGLTERFWMMLDENDNVAMYNHDTGRDVLEYCERQMAQNPGDEFIAAAVERITGAAEFVVIEGDSWRVSVSDILRFRAQIDKEIVSVGVLNKAVMWSRERWEEAQQKRESPEVRRAQAEMLRAAASGIRKPPAVQTTEERVEEAVREAGNGTTGLPSGTGQPGERAANSSAGDGRRNPRILSLQNLGR